MTLWRRARNEVAGAWRSVRYDLGRRGPDTGKAAPVPDSGAGYQDVTSTGMSTFGGLGTGGLRTSYGDEVVPRSRRLAAVAAFGALAVAGAAGSYYAVVTGIDALVADRPAGAEPYPLAAGEPPGARSDDQSHSGLGRGVVPGAPDGPAPATAAPGTVRIPPQAGAVAARRPATPPRPRTTVVGVTPATPPTECCLIPPVPTPTAPVPTPQSPSATASPSASPSDSASPSEEPTTTATPSTSAEPAGTGERRSRARRAHRH
ncbi:hypothetical protein ACIBSW_14755 [Actinoplanes sp. NPDC049668]|uniref:hypothetical protein n=1 Tax=unclassified Actinoplanes TaxID=2626549 RepID=UPI0033B5F9DF